MKKFILIITLILINIFGFSQVNNNFEDGNWLYYSNLCWGISPNNPYFGTKVTDDKCETENLGQSSVCRLESPWINITGNIMFKHSIPNFNGTRNLKVYLLDQNNISTLIWSHNYTNNNILNSTINNAIYGIYKIKWEWTGNGGNSRGQIDNIVIQGIDVSDPSNNCNVFVTLIDTDGDSVPDVDDEYPTDSTRAYNNYYPVSDTSTLVFEDLWPNYGDYDMNDLVINYKFKIVSNYKHNVVEIFNTIIVKAQGAGMANGFGYQFPCVNPSSIIDVSGMGNQNGYNIEPNGTETGNPTSATFIVFENSHNILSNWNTIKNQTPSPYKTFNIHIKFLQNSTSLTSLNISNWNPFLVVNGIRGREVHLPNYKPTNMADMSLFGTNDDDTNPTISKYYKSKNNLPWALDIYGKFDYPIEKSDISQSYLHFIDWVISNGTLYQDWWYNMNYQYRNENLIY